MSERQHKHIQDLMIFIDCLKKEATVVGFDRPFVVRIHPHPDYSDWDDNDRLYETIARAIARDNDDEVSALALNLFCDCPTLVKTTPCGAYVCGTWTAQDVATAAHLIDDF